MKVLKFWSQLRLLGAQTYPALVWATLGLAAAYSYAHLDRIQMDDSSPTANENPAPASPSSTIN
jgi:hypothetical protein